MNKIILKGRVTAEPVIRYGNEKEHICYARFNIAVEDRTWKDENDKSHVDYIPCKAIGKLGELVETHLFKGKEVLLCGKMQSGSYEKDKKKVYTLDLLVQELEFCGKKEGLDTDMEGNFMNIPEGIDEELPFR
jgi:single-strand DNA-binding protein